MEARVRRARARQSLHAEGLLVSNRILRMVAFLAAFAAWNAYSEAPTRQRAFRNDDGRFLQRRRGDGRSRHDPRRGRAARSRGCFCVRSPSMGAARLPLRARVPIPGGIPVEVYRRTGASFWLRVDTTSDSDGKRVSLHRQRSRRLRCGLRPRPRPKARVRCSRCPEPLSDQPEAKAQWRLARVEPELLAGAVPLVLVHGLESGNWGEFLHLGRAQCGGDGVSRDVPGVGVLASDDGRECPGRFQPGLCRVRREYRRLSHALS